MIVWYWERRNFHVSFSGRDVRERFKSSLRKFYGRYGDLIKHYEVPLSKMLHDILGHYLYHIQWHPPLIRHFIKSRPCYWTVPYCRFWRNYLIPGGFHRTFATHVASPQRTLTPLDTLSCPIWDLHLFWYWDYSFLNLSCLLTFWVSNIPRYFYYAVHRLSTLHIMCNLWRKSVNYGENLAICRFCQ